MNVSKPCHQNGSVPDNDASAGRTQTFRAITLFKIVAISEKAPCAAGCLKVFADLDKVNVGVSSSAGAVVCHWQQTHASALSSPSRALHMIGCSIIFTEKPDECGTGTHSIL